MRLEHNFTVPVPVEEAWVVLLDLPRIAPCMPGATLTGVADDTFTGTVKVKVGPIAMTYQGKGRFVERDEVARRVVVEASGKDSRSAGTAAATVTATLIGEDAATRVEVITDLTVTGKPAQFGRGMIADIGAKLIGQFADCVAGKLTGTPLTGTPDARPSPATSAATTSAGATSAPSTSAAATSAAATSAPSTSAAPTSAPTTSAPATPAPATATGWSAVQGVEAEPLDLLRLTGGTATARRLAVAGVGTALLALLAWAATRRLRR